MALGKYQVAGCGIAYLLAAVAAFGADEFDARDLSGNWSRQSAIVTFGNVPGARRAPDNRPLPDVEPVAEPPFTQRGRELYLANRPSYGANSREFERNDPIGRCTPGGIPRNLNAEIIEPHDTFELVHLGDRVIQFFEYRHDWREIWLDGRDLPAPDDVYPTWNGFSVGRWEEDVLVVETIGFDDRTWLDKYGYPHSESMHLEERYRLVDAETLELTMVISDPEIYTAPWQSDRKTFQLDRDKHHQWDEQIYCVPDDELAFQETFQPGRTAE